MTCHIKFLLVHFSPLRLDECEFLSEYTCVINARYLNCWSRILGTSYGLIVQKPISLNGQKRNAFPLGSLRRAFGNLLFLRKVYL